MRITYREQIGLLYPVSTMSKLRFFVSATIVLIFASATAHAAPQPTVPDDKPVVTEDVDPVAPPDENMSLAPAPTARPGVYQAARPEYYNYASAFTVRGGTSSDFPKISLDDSLIGFAYMFPKFLSPKLEAGADLHESGRGHIHVGVRWIYFERSYFRPSVKLAVDHYIDGRYGLGTLVKREDWFARGSATLEYVFWNPYSLRLEPEMLVNFDQTTLVLTLGLSRGW